MNSQTPSQTPTPALPHTGLVPQTTPVPPEMPATAEAQHLVSPSTHKNGSPARGPASSRRTKVPEANSPRRLWVLGGLILLAIVVLAAGAGLVGKLFGKAPFTGPVWVVKREKLKVSIVERGSLESAKNGDIICNVRSGTKGSTIATMIKWIIDPGVEVKKGEKIMELESSGFVESLKEQNIKVDKAKADWVTAEEQFRIQESQNESDIEAAKNVLDLAKIDLEKYVKGDFVQSVKDVEGRIETARSDLENWKDRAAWSARMLKKGLLSKVAADADASRVDGSRIAMEKVEEEKRVLVYYMQKRTVQDLGAKLAEANRALDRVKSQSRAKLAQAEALRQSNHSVYEQELSKKREIEGEIAKCTVLAPQDGLVVYYVPAQVRGGGGTQQSIVAQGEPVREGQKMVQIPDLSHMQVNVRVHEAMISTLHNEDSNDPSTWQHAQIRVDAFPTRVFNGHIKTVDTMASQQDWFASDVKVYKTIVTIDDQAEGLKPDMSAEVTIYADESSSEVLVVPVQSVVGTINMGANRECFVVGADGQPQKRDIVVGMSNQRVVEVKSGLQEGDKVVLNPGPLLDEGSDKKPGKVHTKADDDGQESTGAAKKGMKGKKKSGGGPGNFNAPSPGGGPGTAAPAAKGFGAGLSDEQKQAYAEKMRNSTPAERREMINRLPEAFRDTARQKLRAQGLEVAD